MYVTMASKGDVLFSWFGSLDCQLCPQDILNHFFPMGLGNVCKMATSLIWICKSMSRWMNNSIQIVERSMILAKPYLFIYKSLSNCYQRWYNKQMRQLNNVTGLVFSKTVVLEKMKTNLRCLEMYLAFDVLSRNYLIHRHRQAKPSQANQPCGSQEVLKLNIHVLKRKQSDTGPNSSEVENWRKSFLNTCLFIYKS